MSKEFLYEATVHGVGISFLVTKHNEIMVEMSDNNCITPSEIEQVVNAKGLNPYFNALHKYDFAKRCHFNNILITKCEINDESNNEAVCGFYLSELRKSKSKLAKLLGVEE